MAGGRGERLKQLTEDRCKPAAPFGGKFRIIDFVLSNCLNSGIRQISVLTQYKAHSLIQHIGKGWGFLRGEFGEFIEIIPAQQRRGPEWYQGTADCAVAEHGPDSCAPAAARAGAGRRSHLQDGLRPDDRLPRREGSGHHGRRRRSAARSCTRIRRARGRRRQSRARLPGEAERSRSPCRAVPTSRSRRWVSTSSIRACSSACCAPTPRTPDSAHDFGKNIIPDAIDNLRVYAYPFEDVRTQGAELLARRRHRRCVLRSEPWSSCASRPS